MPAHPAPRRTLGGARNRAVVRTGGLSLAMLLMAGGFALSLVGTDRLQDRDVPEPAPFTVAVQPADTPVGPAVPVNPGELSIPALGILAPFSLAPLEQGSLQLPSDPSQLSVWSGGGKPCGQSGTVLIAGHVINHSTRGALWNLHKVVPGTLAYLGCTDGTSTAWYATEATEMPKDQLPSDVFRADGRRRLVVVTCGGPVMANGHYRDNVVIWFSPATG